MLEDLTETERRLCEAFFQGSQPSARRSESSDPALGKARVPDRVVRAEVIQSLLIDDAPAAPRTRAVLNVVGLQVVGVLDLASSHIACELSFQHCSFTETPDLRRAELRSVSFDHSRLPGLRMDNATISGDLSIEASMVDGEVGISSARIKGSAILSGSEIASSTAPAINGSRLMVDGNLRIDQGFTTRGEVVFVDAHVAGFLSLSGAVLKNEGAIALKAARLIVDGPVFCNENFTAKGAVTFQRARLGSFLDLGSARLSNPGGDAVSADYLSVGSVRLGGAIVHGGVSFLDAHVRGPFDLSGAQLHNSGGTSFNGSRLIVDGPMFCRGNFAAEGAVALRRARIGGFLDFVDASLSNPGGSALFAPVLTVEGGLSCTRTRFAGQISLTQSKISGSLDLSGAHIDPQTAIAADCVRLVTPRLCLPREPTDGILDLSYAQLQILDAPVETLRAEVQACGLTYETLEPLLDAKQRLVWLTHGTGYVPQVFEQLASAYRRIGHDVDARTVLLAKQRRRRQSLPIGAKIWGFVQDLTTGYGYRPALAAGWLAALLVVGTTVFSIQPPTPKEDATHFNPFFYTLDLLLPILTYGQESSFAPQGGYQWFAYGLVTIGWILATAVISGVTRVLGRN